MIHNQSKYFLLFIVNSYPPIQQSYF